MAPGMPLPDLSSDGAETLADALARGPLPLAPALRCATEVARHLYEIHLQGRTYGKVVAENVRLLPAGAQLAPSRRHWDHGSKERDIHAFGGMLFEMVTGTKVPLDASSSMFRAVGPTSGPAGIRLAAVRLAGKCLGLFPMKLNMQQVATEVRLLSVVARQFEAGGTAEPEVAMPFLVSAPAAAPEETALPLPVPPRMTAPRQRTLEIPLPRPEPTAPPAPSADIVEIHAEESDGPPAPLVVPIEATSFGKPTPKTPPALEPAGGNCPKCDNSVVYVSRPRSRFERRLVSWNIPICRCHRCYHRYVIFMGLKITKDMPVGTERRFKPRRRS